MASKETPRLDSEDPLGPLSSPSVSEERSGLGELASPPHHQDTVHPDPVSVAAAQAPSSQEPETMETEMETEIVDDEEFDYLDKATQLAELQSEFEDTRTSLARRRNRGVYVPLKLFGRNRGSSIISVTDVTSGLWCETKVEYRHLHPTMKRTTGWKKMEEKGAPVQLRTPVMKEGTSIHLKKELEVHEPVEVKTETKEDRQAVQLITTYMQLATVKTGAVEREIAVFGDPVEGGVVLRGVIDQLQYSPETNELTLLDYKTRVQKTLPGEEQKRGNKLQLMLYKNLLDGFTTGVTNFDVLDSVMGLSYSVELSLGPLEHIKQCGLESLFQVQALDETGGQAKVTFGQLVKHVTELIVGLGLPLVGPLLLQYEHQGSGEVIGVDTVVYDESWMRQELENSLKFWKGERAAKGVDLEDAWKCGFCQFKDICVWKLQRELQQSPAAKNPPEQWIV